jgi:hypothetical protein
LCKLKCGKVNLPGWEERGICKFLGLKLALERPICERQDEDSRPSAPCPANRLANKERATPILRRKNREQPQMCDGHSAQQEPAIPGEPKLTNSILKAYGWRAFNYDYVIIMNRTRRSCPNGHAAFVGARGFSATEEVRRSNAKTLKCQARFRI